MMTNELEAINSSIKFHSPAPSGIEAGPKRFPIMIDMNGRLNKLYDEIGMSKSLLMTTAIALGLHNQPEIVQDLTDPHDHSYTVAEHVQCFDALVKIRLQMSNVLNKLSLDLEARRESAKLAHLPKRGKHGKAKPSHVN